MDEPAEWRALADKFSELAQWADALHACYGPPSTGAPWFLGGLANRRLHSGFLRYAERGAVLLGHPPGPNAAFYWFDLLKDSPYHDVIDLTHQTDDGRLESEQGGVIWHVCVACADHCYELETLAVARERAKSMRTIGHESSPTVQPESHNAYCPTMGDLRADDKPPGQAATVACGGNGAERSAAGACSVGANADQGIGEDVMHQRPKLPLETRAAIERSIEQALWNRRILFPHLFSPIMLGGPDALEGVLIPRKKAILLTELTGYAFILFYAEAKHYPGHARNELELRGWLHGLASCVEAEVIHETRDIAHYHDYHCAASERQLAIAELLNDWIDRQTTEGLKLWIDQQARDTASKAERAASEQPLSANLENADETLKGGREILDRDPAEHDQGGYSIPRQVAEPAVIPQAFPERAAWLKSEMRNRGHLTAYALHKAGGPDPKTIKRILEGKLVNPGKLELVASALSLRGPMVSISDIPTG
jgi:hypothetical protein